jgi:hypothetical protein
MGGTVTGERTGAGRDPGDDDPGTPSGEWSQAFDHGDDVAVAGRRRRMTRRITTSRMARTATATRMGTTRLSPAVSVGTGSDEVSIASGKMTVAVAWRSVVPERRVMLASRVRPGWPGRG